MAAEVGRMTDARIPERWLNDRRINRLSDAYHRAFFNALVWSVANQTDGLIEPSDLEMIPRMRDGAPETFVAAGLWTDEGGRWLIVDFQDTQVSRDELQQLKAARRRDRDRKARQRAAKAAAENASQSVVPRDSPGDSPRDINRTGQDRPGQDRTTNATAHESSDNGELSAGMARRIARNVARGYES